MENKQISLMELPCRETEVVKVSTSHGLAEKAPIPRFQKIDREQLSWRSINVERLIEEDHPARALWDFIGNLDLSGYTKHIRAVEGSAGRPLWSPQLLISLWIYAYSQGVGSARAIERLCEHDPAYQWLTGMEVVNAHSLSDFRVKHEEELKGLFVQILGLLSAEGLITLERVTQDGTKIRAWAAQNSFKGKDRIEKAIEAAREQVKAVDQVSEEETSRRVEKARRRAHLERKARLEKALEQFDRKKAEGGVKDKGKPKVSITDPEARIMKQPEGGFAPSYNVQVNTDAANGLVVAVGVTQAGNDLNQLTSGVERIEANFGETPKQVLADGGYVSRDNIVAMDTKEVDFIAPQCDEVGKAKSNYESLGISEEYGKSLFVYDSAENTYRCPQGKTLRFKSIDRRGSKLLYLYSADMADCQSCAAKGLCCPKSKSGRTVQRTEELPQIIKFREKMKTERAKEIYRQRSQIAETPNLWIKSKFKLRQFSVRGLRKVGIESLWVCLTYNVCQWIRLCWKKQTAIASAIV